MNGGEIREQKNKPIEIARKQGLNNPTKVQLEEMKEGILLREEVE